MTPDGGLVYSLYTCFSLKNLMIFAKIANKHRLDCVKKSPDSLKHEISPTADEPPEFCGKILTLLLHKIDFAH